MRSPREETANFDHLTRRKRRKEHSPPLPRSKESLFIREKEKKRNRVLSIHTLSHLNASIALIISQTKKCFGLKNCFVFSLFYSFFFCLFVCSSCVLISTGKVFAFTCWWSASPTPIVISLLIEILSISPAGVRDQRERRGCSSIFVYWRIVENSTWKLQHVIDVQKRGRENAKAPKFF